MVELAPDKNPSGRRAEGLEFGDIVGQTELKQALLVGVANDALDGVLVRGEKGTAKSTAVRALPDLLPRQRAVADCPFGCHPEDPALQCADCRDRADPPVEQRPVPLVTLPLGATRDRVVGTLSVEDAMAGDHEFEAGLLARAHRGILYVDEVNLLDDHLVDVLLDVAASGRNRVERDGVSVTHPADFTLVGTMNPEEGDLRPQLRDRFGIQAEVAGSDDVTDRVAVIEQAIAGPDAVDRDDGPDTATYRDRLRGAIDLLPDVDLPEEFATDIATLCRDAGVDGHRGDIAVARTARTLAALDGRTAVIEGDVRRAAELALPHRLQSRPFEDAPDPEEVVDDHFKDDEREGESDAESDESGEGDAEGDSGVDGGDEDDDADGETETGKADGDADEPGQDRADSQGDGDTDQRGADEGGDGRSDGPSPTPDPSANGEAPGSAGDAEEASGQGDDEGRGDADDGEDETATPVVPGQARAGVGESAAPDLDAPDALAGGDGGGSRSRTAGTDSEGVRVRTKQADSSDPVDAAASVRAAARRGGDGVTSRDLRASVRESETGALVLFVVDASASMRPAMRAAKGTVLELLKDAYQHRDEVGFVAVAGESADVVLPPTDSVTHAARHLKDLPTGDRTPLPDGLTTACEVLDRADPDAALVVLVTDGRANVADGSPTGATRDAADSLAGYADDLVVVDAGQEGRAGVTDIVLDATGGTRIPLSALSAEHLDAAVETRR